MKQWTIFLRSHDHPPFTFVLAEIMNDVIRATVRDHNKTPGKMEWRVLIVDNQSMRMVSACTKMHELSAEGITSKVKKHWYRSSKYMMFYDISVVETIEKRREPLPAMEAIYLITPSESSVKGLMTDFQSQNRTQYRAAHVYFTEGKPHSWWHSFFFEMSRKAKFVKVFFSIVNVSIFSLLQLSNRSQLSGLRSYISILWFSVWFSVCPEPLFNQLSRSSAVKRINTMKEINMSFMPIERQVCRYFGMARRW